MVILMLMIMMVLLLMMITIDANFTQGMGATYQGFSSATAPNTLHPSSLTLHPSSLPDISIHSHLKDTSRSLLTLDRAELSGLLPERILIVWNSHPPSASFANVNVLLVSFSWVSAYLRANSSTSLVADSREGPWFDPALVKISVVLSSTVWKWQEQNHHSNLDFAASPRYTAQQCVQTILSGLDWNCNIPQSHFGHMISQKGTIGMQRGSVCYVTAFNAMLGPRCNCCLQLCRR